jgi:Rieske Fe-S protein
MAEDRRTLLKVLTGLFGGGAAVVVGVPVVRALVDPAGKVTVTGSGDFLRVASADAVPQDGTPLKLPIVIASPSDAWVKLPPTEVGSIFLRRANDRIVAYSTICPHLGCGVDYSPEKHAFACPCHESAFGLDGTVAGGPSPRALDELESRVVDGQVEVKYERFKQGTKDKVLA